MTVAPTDRGMGKREKERKTRWPQNVSMLAAWFRVKVPVLRASTQMLTALCASLSLFGDHMVLIHLSNGHDNIIICTNFYRHLML